MPLGTPRDADYARILLQAESDRQLSGKRCQLALRMALGTALRTLTAFGTALAGCTTLIVTALVAFMLDAAAALVNLLREATAESLVQTLRLPLATFAALAIALALYPSHLSFSAVRQRFIANRVREHLGVTAVGELTLIAIDEDGIQHSGA